MGKAERLSVLKKENLCGKVETILLIGDLLVGFSLRWAVESSSSSFLLGGASLVGGRRKLLIISVLNIENYSTSPDVSILTLLQFGGSSGRFVTGNKFDKCISRL